MKEMIRLVGITKEFEQNTIIPTLDLTIGDGEFVTLLGLRAAARRPSSA